MFPDNIEEENKKAPTSIFFDTLWYSKFGNDKIIILHGTLDAFFGNPNNFTINWIATCVTR